MEWRGQSGSGARRPGWTWPGTAGGSGDPGVGDQVSETGWTQRGSSLVGLLTSVLTGWDVIASAGYWWNRFGPLFADEIRRRRVNRRNRSNGRRHLDEVFVGINGETHYLWRDLWRAVTYGGRSIIKGRARGVCHETAGSQGYA